MHREFAKTLAKIEDRARNLLGYYDFDSLLVPHDFFSGEKYLVALQTTKEEAQAVRQERFLVEWFIYCVLTGYIARLNAAADDAEYRGWIATALCYGAAFMSLAKLFYEPSVWLGALSSMSLMAVLVVGRFNDWTQESAADFDEVALAMARCIHVQLERSAQEVRFISAVNHMRDEHSLGPVTNWYLAVSQESVG